MPLPERPDYSELLASLPALRRYAQRLCRDSDAAADLVQATAERAIVKWALFRPDTNRRKWLLAIMYNVHVNRYRRRLRRPIEVPIERAFADADIDGSPEHRFIATCDPAIGLAVRDAQRALDRMSAQMREAVLLAAVSHPSYADMAAAADPPVPIGTIRSRLSRGREALRAADIL